MLSEEFEGLPLTLFFFVFFYYCCSTIKYSMLAELILDLKMLNLLLMYGLCKTIEIWECCINTEVKLQFTWDDMVSVIS